MIHMTIEIVAGGYQLWAQERVGKVLFKRCQIWWTFAGVKASHVAQMELFQAGSQTIVCMKAGCKGPSAYQVLRVCLICRVCMYVRSLCWTSFHCPAEKLEGDRIQWLLSRVTWLGQAPGAAHRVVILLDVTNPCTPAKAVHHQQGHSDSGHHNSTMCILCPIRQQKPSLTRVRRALVPCKELRYGTQFHKSRVCYA